MPASVWGVILLLLFSTQAIDHALAQPDPSGRPLTVNQVKAELEARLLREPSYATIWNTGYDFYRLHLRNQDTARIIYLGFMSVRGSTPEENRAIRQAAI
jgi:hypothetical protein